MFSLYDANNTQISSSYYNIINYLVMISLDNKLQIILKIDENENVFSNLFGYSFKSYMSDKTLLFFQYRY